MQKGHRAKITRRPGRGNRAEPGERRGGGGEEGGFGGKREIERDSEKQGNWKEEREKKGNSVEERKDKKRHQHSKL